MEPLVLERALTAHCVVGRSGADKFLEGSEAHARIVDLGLDGEMLADVPTAERAPLTHSGLEVVAIAVDGCEVKTALEAPVELCLRRSLERESAYERKRYQQFFHYCMFLFFLMVHAPSEARALRVLYPCVFKWKARRRGAATFQGANVCIYFCIAICGSEGRQVYYAKMRVASASVGKKSMKVVAWTWRALGLGRFGIDDLVVDKNFSREGAS